jgi:hypothetical protein
LTARAFTFTHYRPQAALSLTIHGLLTAALIEHFGIRHETAQDRVRSAGVGAKIAAVKRILLATDMKAAPETPAIVASVGAT